MRFKKAELDIRTRYIADLEKRLTTYFKDYRNDQKIIIESLLKGHDTVVRLKTGGGKSLCFQAPAIISQGVTIVISPLQALCNDQVDGFNKKYCTDAVVEFNKKYVEAHPECAGFLSEKKPRAGFDSSISELVKKDNEDNIEYKLLYLSPEMLSKPVYRQELTEAVALGRLKISMIIFDEAHCLSEWGFSFRESYFQICGIIANLKKYQDIPIGVFSATLTPASVEQLKLLLDMKKPKEFGICTDKSASKVKNGSLSVKRDDLNVFILNCDDESPFSRYDYLFILLENVTFKKCIIYCNFIEQVDTIRWLFLQFIKDSGNLSKNSISYHGKMYHSARLGAEFKYANKTSGYDIIVATKAYGMGIDNRDVDLVIHFDVPESIETYYQEIGRAGRSSVEGHNNNVIMLYQKKPYPISKKGSLSERSCFFIGTEESTKAFVRSGVSIVNNVYSESPIIPRLENRSKRAFKSSAIYSFEVLKKYIEENLNGQPISKAQAVECLGENMWKCYNDMTIFPCDQTIIDEYFHGKEFKFEKVRKYSAEKTNKDLKRVISQINELYINNTLIANEIRNFAWFYKPDENGTICNKGKVIAEKAILEEGGGSIEGYRLYDRSTEWKRELKDDFILDRHIYNDCAFVYVRNETLSGRREFELRYHAQKMLIDDIKSKAEEPNFDYVYVFTDVSIGGAHSKSKYVDYIVCAVYKADKEIFDGIISGDSDNENENFLQILGYSKGEKYNIEIGFDEEETERQINKYFNNDSEELSDVSDDERAVSYIDKKLNKLLTEKDITELYDGLLGKQKGNKKQNPRIVFKKGQRRNDMCCTLWYQDGTAYEKAPLTYFDMCVFDAVCTIYNNDRKEFYLNNIWEILSGNEGIRFSRNVLKDKLRESVEKLQRLRIFIAGTENAPQEVGDNIGERFLNVQRGQDTSGREVYEIRSCPRLWTYAVETQEGQIARVPLYKLDGRRYFKWEQYDRSGEEDCSTVSGLYGFLNSDKRSEILRKMKSKSILDPEYKCSIWKVVLHFYLAHRLSIIKRKNKMRLIKYDTIEKLMEAYLPETLKNGEKKDLLCRLCMCYMFWAVLPKHENYRWEWDVYHSRKTLRPMGLRVIRVERDVRGKSSA